MSRVAGNYEDSAPVYRWGHTAWKPYASRVFNDGGTMLQRGDLVPHFTVNALHGEEFSYETIWQRRNLVTLARLAEVREAAPAYGFNSITERPRQVTA